MASVDIKNLWKRYGGLAAVQGIDLSIGDGEFIALLGPSGCGKTSTMRMIAGLERISDGQIYFNGELVNSLPPSKRKVAMAFENYALYPTLDVFENLAFPLRALGWSDAEIGVRVREVAGVMSLTELLERKVPDLSNGQQQAVGLARALTRRPEVLLLDEPISHLDTRQRTYMRAYLKKLHVALGYTMVYVTHDQEEAMAMSDRIAVMNAGKVNQVGAPIEIYANPADVFVAGFIGEPAMNLLDCERDGEELRLADATLPMPERYRATAQAGRVPERLVLGIRPFFIDLASLEDGGHGLPVEVFVVEDLGDMTVLTANLGDMQILVARPPGFKARPGDRLRLRFDPAHVLLFDRATGKAIES